MITRRTLLITVAGTLLVGVAVSEHLYRRLFERRYEASMQAQEQLQQYVQQTLAANHQILAHLLEEQGKTQDLSRTLTEKSAELDKTLARLQEEQTAAESLQNRMASMKRQMDKLQEELVVALEKQEDVGAGAAARGTKKADNKPVELERIIVSENESEATPQGHVVSVHPDWSFVVVSLGWNEVKIGDMVSIFHNETLMAKARVERVQEGMAAATVLPDWPIDQVRINDAVRAL